MRFAFLVAPHLGGTYTAYRMLREGLGPFGLELRWLATGQRAHDARADPEWSAEWPHGDAVGHPLDDEPTQTEALIRALEQRGFAGVFVNVLTSQAEMNVARHLRRDILRIAVVHNITPGTYAAARAIRDHVHATIGVSPRIRDDLVRRHAFPSAHTLAIAHGVDDSATPALPRREDGPDARALRLIALGRIEDASKGVFWLPRIVACLPPEITLTVAGDGPDLPTLRRLCAGLGEQVRFVGGVPAARTRELLAAHDVLLFPSRFEGFGFVLAEAMAVGCVPVASRISGVTDVLIENGISGFTVGVGDVAAAARGVKRLAASRSLLHSMSAAARATIRGRFTAETMASHYADVMRSIAAAPPPIAAPCDLRHWHVPRTLRATLRMHVPAPLKNLLRTARERIAS
jgi:glycosyltransferase involved in cell wall biosynthesis